MILIVSLEVSWIGQNRMTHQAINAILRSGRMPNEWRKSTLIPIYKNKEIFKVMQTTTTLNLGVMMKLWERVIEHDSATRQERKRTSYLCLVVVRWRLYSC